MISGQGYGRDVSEHESELQEQRSRTALSKDRKAAEKRLASLAAALVGLSPKQLARLPLSEELIDAVDEGRRMTSRGARARQLRIVRRELRNSDSDTIACEVDALLNPHGRPTKATRQAQGWLERFMAEGDAALDAFLLAHESADRQRLRRLIRNTRSDNSQRAAKAKKTLLSLIIETMQQTSAGM